MASRKLVTVGDLDYLREDSLRAVLFCMLAVLYTWCLVLFQPINLQPVDQIGDAMWGPVFMGIGLALAFAIQKRSPSLAATAAIAGLVVAMLSTMWVTGAKVAPYMLAVVVSLAGLLFSMRIVVVTTVLCSIAVAVVSLLRWGYSPVSAEVLSPVLVIGVVGVLSFLAVRNLYVALHWALDRAMAAQRNEEEARIHRGELARTLKALTEAYQRLEYVNYDLARAREAAEEARLNKQRFVASVSHEMRTPLNVLTALSEMMYLSPERYGDTPQTIMELEGMRILRESLQNRNADTRSIDGLIADYEDDLRKQRTNLQALMADLNSLLGQTTDPKERENITRKIKAQRRLPFSFRMVPA